VIEFGTRWKSLSGAIDLSGVRRFLSSVFTDVLVGWSLLLDVLVVPGDLVVLDILDVLVVLGVLDILGILVVLVSLTVVLSDLFKSFKSRKVTYFFGSLIQPRERLP
jgi:hypothetical protein